MAKSKVIDRDLGYKDIIEQLRILDSKPYVKVGITKGSGMHDEAEGMTVAEVAILHEFGAPVANIPERSFIRSSFDENKENYHKLVKKLKDNIYMRKITVSKALDILGQTAQKDIKNKIVNGSFAPLSQVTIDKKKSDKPLIDTSQMLNSVNYEKVMKKWV